MSESEVSPFPSTESSSSASEYCIKDVQHLEGRISTENWPFQLSKRSSKVREKQMRKANNSESLANFIKSQKIRSILTGDYLSTTNSYDSRGVAGKSEQAKWKGATDSNKTNPPKENGCTKRNTPQIKQKQKREISWGEKRPGRWASLGGSFLSLSSFILIIIAVGIITLLYVIFTCDCIID